MSEFAACKKAEDESMLLVATCKEQPQCATTTPSPTTTVPPTTTGFPKQYLGLIIA